MFKDITLSMEVWTLNQIYDKIKNCQVIKPPYENDKWLYNTSFFLDKREWLTYYTQLSWYDITDHILANWINYYLANNWTQARLYADNWTTLVQVAWPFVINSLSPKRLVKWFWSWWNKIISWTITNSSNEPTHQYYWDWLIKLTLSNITNVLIWNYIFFISWVLAGTSNKILDKQWSNVYILWTNTRWTLPESNATYEVYNTYQETLLIWWTAWLSLILLNWILTANSLTLFWEFITDVVSFNGVIFVLSNKKIFFSRKTFDSNTWFYPTDRFHWDWIDKLIDLWKILFCYWNWSRNKILSPAVNTDNTIWYLEYQANYDGNLFSKYSFINTEWTFYAIDLKKWLKQFDIVTFNATTYDIIEKEVTYNTRWLFESLVWWEIYIDADDRFINFCNIYNWNTIIFQYDKQYQHWLLQEYIWIKIYKYSSDKVCITWWITNKIWFKDLWIDYKQEINFIISDWMKLIMPVFIKTYFWLTNISPIELDLDIQYPIWANIKTDKLKFKNYYFDTNLDGWAEIDNLLWQEETWNSYNWNMVCLSKVIYRTWRNILFTYNSNNRFIIWESFLRIKYWKQSINELLLLK